MQISLDEVSANTFISVNIESMNTAGLKLSTEITTSSER